MNFWVGLITFLGCSALALVGSLAWLKENRSTDVRKFVYFCLSYGLYIFSNTLQDNWLRLIPNPSETIVIFADIVSYVAAVFGLLSPISFLAFFEHQLSPFFQRPKRVPSAINILLILFGYLWLDAKTRFYAYAVYTAPG